MCNHDEEFAEVGDEEVLDHILWLEGAAEALSKRGLLDAPISITPRGIAAYDQLTASGWRPQAQMIRRLLQEYGMPEEHLDLAVDLFMNLPE